MSRILNERRALKKSGFMIIPIRDEVQQIEFKKFLKFEVDFYYNL